MDRRDFIKMLGLAGTSAAAYAACSKYMSEALAQSTTIDDLLTASAHCHGGSLKDIDHVILLMQENRSFDHYYGTLRGVRGFGDPRPLRLKEGKPVFTQPRFSGAPGWGDVFVGLFRGWEVKPFRQRQKGGYAGDYSGPGLPHEFEDGRNAINGGWNDKWVPVKGELALSHFQAETDLPYYKKLIDAFTLCDSYHCSSHAGTNPNRSFFYSGTSHGWTDNRFFFRAQAPFPNWKTYPEYLQERDVSWKFYQNGLDGDDNFFGNFDDTIVKWFDQYRDSSTKIYERALSVNTVLRTDPDKPSQLETDIRSGSLPAVSWINAPGYFCDGPASSPHFGEYYVNEILSALAANPEVWRKTVFIINYDENDGFFDHVPPPMPPLPGVKDSGKVSKGINISTDAKHLDAEHAVRLRKEIDNPEYNPGKPAKNQMTLGLGNRVPCLIISPWTVGGRVCSELFDHTSTLRFLEAWLAAKGKSGKGDGLENISSWRRAVCGDMTSAFDFERKLETVAKTGKDKLDAAIKSAKPVPPYFTTAQQEAVKKGRLGYAGATQDIAIDNAGETRRKQAKGQVELLPLGYDFNVYASVTMTDGKVDKFNLTFQNKGSIGVALNVYSYHATDKDRGAWFYALTKAGKDGQRVEVVDAYDLKDRGGTYEFAVHGPNGYLSEFKGDANNANQKLIADIVEVKSDSDAAKVRFDFGPWPSANGGLTMINAYTGESVSIAAGTNSVTSATKDGWYDVAFIDKAGQGYLRRYAGHLENGKISKTDPAIGLRYDAGKRVYIRESA
jgi:phospholipase C